MVRNAGEVKGASDDHHHRVESKTIRAATLVAAIALDGLFAPAAVRAGEYCSEDASRGTAASARWSNARQRYPEGTRRASAIRSSRTTASRRSKVKQSILIQPRRTDHNDTSSNQFEEPVWRQSLFIRIKPQDHRH